MSFQITALKAPKKFAAGAFAALTLALAGCATGPSANTVSSSAQGYASTVRQGTVVSVRAVTIKPNNSLLGAATGAVLGGLAGSELGGGDKANTAGAIGGAVLGGLAGNAAGQAMSTKQGVAVTIDFGNGDLKEIVQAADIAVQPGQLVNVAFRQDGVFVSPATYAPPAY